MIRTFAAVPLLLAALGAQDLATLVAHLDDKDGKKRAAAYRKLLDAPAGKVLPLLRKRAPGFGYTGQIQSILLLERYPAAKTRATLRKLTTCGAPMIECACAANLYKAGEPKYAAVIAKALRDAKNTASHQATMLARLDGIADAQVIEALHDLLAPRLSTANVARVLKLLTKTPHAGTDPALDRLVTVPDCPSYTLVLVTSFQFAEGHHEHAARFAAKVGRLRSVPAEMWPYLVRASRLEKVVLDAIGGFAQRTGRVDALRSALDVLEQHRAAALDPTLAALTRHRTKSVAELAFERLATDRERLKTETLRQQLADPDDWRRLIAADILRRRDDRAGLPVAIEILRAKSGPHVEAVELLGKYRRDEAIPPLIEALNHRTLAVRTRAASALTRLLGARFPYKKFDLSTAGYDPKGTPEQRDAARVRIGDWWTKNRDED